MKSLTVCILLALICLHRADATALRSVEGNIHQRITSVPSRGRSAPKSLERGSVPTIQRTIKTLRKPRRVPSEDYGRIRPLRHTTEYPKHHLLQPIPTPNLGQQPVNELLPTTAPYTENHHSWKKTKPVWLE